jgi:hypothetical protein
MTVTHCASVPSLLYEVYHGTVNHHINLSMHTSFTNVSYGMTFEICLLIDNIISTMCYFERKFSLSHYIGDYISIGLSTR